MSMPKYAKRIDQAQPAIVKALRKAGVRVWIISEPCDLLTQFRGRWQPLEVKNLDARPRSDQVEQQQFLAETGVPMVRTPEQALAAVGAADGYVVGEL